MPSIYNAVSSVVNDYTSQSTAKSVLTSDKTESFDEIYNAAVNLISSTNGYIQQAQQAEIDYAMGELTSTHELSVIQQKANISLQYTVAIKNAIMDAYKEIMQMSV